MKIRSFLTFASGVLAGSCYVLSEQNDDWRLTAVCWTASFAAGLMIWRTH